MTDEIQMSEALKNMLTYVDADPNNIALLSDTAQMALDEGEPDAAIGLLEQYAMIAKLPDKETGVLALSSMLIKDYQKAARLFSELYEKGLHDPAICFNLAWSRAMLKNFEGAMEVLSTDTTDALPQAAMLKLQILHDQGQFEEAEVYARELAGDDLKHSGLNAAISVLALDIEDVDLARKAAKQAGAHPDALTTLGTLALGDDDSETAMALFDQALALSEQGPRSWTGKGLAQLLQGKNDKALINIDRGAEMFETHIGSWIAAGWAHFIENDLLGARERFEKALSLDQNFAESHGSLAVIDFIEGRLEESKRKTKTALKLDANCFSAALAQVMRLSSNGNSKRAEAIFQKAMHTPIDDKGRTIARSLTRLGLAKNI